jgi:hypothetical protein
MQPKIIFIYQEKFVIKILHFIKCYLRGRLTFSIQLIKESIDKIKFLELALK